MTQQPRRPSEPQVPFDQLLKNGRLGVIENPLRRIPEDRLNECIESFFQECDFTGVLDLPTIIDGAHLAKEEEAFKAEKEEGGNLNDIDRTALKKEKSARIWTETKDIKTILLICSIGSVLQGWVQGAIIGANQLWPGRLHLDLNGPNNQGLSPPSPGKQLWQFSAANAIVFFAAGSVGAFLCDPFTEVFMGRRGAIFAAALFTFTASIGEAFVPSWEALFACRFVGDLTRPLARYDRSID
ncbi:MAG: hypothetical protein Q9222_003290 [Ikaeria aurantiellina]